jgi:predicted DNA-binding transcriptional regulator AlpA
MESNISTTGFLRLPQVLEIVPVSRSSWWAGCKTGRYPKPVKIGPRTTAWKAADIAALVERLGNKEER